MMMTMTARPTTGTGTTMIWSAETRSCNAAQLAVRHLAIVHLLSLQFHVSRCASSTHSCASSSSYIEILRRSPRLGRILRRIASARFATGDHFLRLSRVHETAARGLGRGRGRRDDCDDKRHLSGALVWPNEIGVAADKMHLSSCTLYFAPTFRLQFALTRPKTSRLLCSHGRP